MTVLSELKFDGFAERCYEVNSDIWTSKVFLDIETLSLVGTPLTVIGLLQGGEKPTATQLFLLKEEGERELLLRFLELTKDAEVVTYNGANLIFLLLIKASSPRARTVCPKSSRGFVSHSKA